MIAPNKAGPDQVRATSYDESKAYLPTKLFIERLAAIADYFDATDPPARRARFGKFVMEGKGQMPPWQGTLNQTEVDQLWAYIRANAYDK